MEKFKIIKIKNNRKEVVEDIVAEEVTLTIAINNKELVTFLCTPENINDLVAGYLFTSGIIQKIEDIKKINLDKKKWIAYTKLVNDDIIKELVFKRLQPPGCGKGVILYNDTDLMKEKKNLSNLKIKSSAIIRLMINFQRQSEIYIKTGGTHSAAMADQKNIIVFREDIGRHNAVDKIIGNRLLNHDSFDDKIILTSGRISSEIILKVQKCNIPIIASKSAPTNTTVKHCKKMNITLIGFIRGSRMNIYAGEERIL